MFNSCKLYFTTVFDSLWQLKELLSYPQSTAQSSTQEAVDSCKAWDLIAVTNAVISGAVYINFNNVSFYS